MKSIKLLIFLNICVAEAAQKRYNPNWNDLDTRPLPDWYDKAKIGIFVHLGIYSVPAVVDEWFPFWYELSLSQEINKEAIKDNSLKDRIDRVKSFMQKNYHPDFKYKDFAPFFTAEHLDTDDWIDLFQKAGAKYVVLTSKHHDGFALFPSRQTSWNSVLHGPKRDLVGELERSAQKKNMTFGVQYSLFEWFNPLYNRDRDRFYNTKFFVDKVVWPDLKQIIQDYKPSLIWSDGDFNIASNYWNSSELLAWVYNDSPVKDKIVVNDRWGWDLWCHHGDFRNCEDKYNPRILKDFKWENALSLDRNSWGYRRDMTLEDMLTFEQLIEETVSTVSCGGNILINVGPTSEGIIPELFQKRLLSLGKWLETNGDAIYNTSPWYRQSEADGRVWFTCKKTPYHGDAPTAPPRISDFVAALYAIFLDWPNNEVLKIEAVARYLNRSFKVQLLGCEGSLNWKIANGTSFIELPKCPVKESQPAWALKFTR